MGKYERNMIKVLNEELKIKEKFGEKDIYDFIKLFVFNENLIKTLIENGFYTYLYTHYLKDIKGTNFEKVMYYLNDLIKNAEKINFEAVKSIYLLNYDKISRSFEDAILNSNLYNTNDSNIREDILVKKYFQCIGEFVESSLKPFIDYFIKIIEIIEKKETKLNTLGDKVDFLINYNTNFKIALEDAFHGIKISQWRNINDHISYEYKREDKIIVSYGKNNCYSKYIKFSDLLSILKNIEILKYVFKIVYEGWGINNRQSLEPYLLKNIQNKSTNNLYDNTLICLVEAYFYKGFKIVDIDKNKDELKIKSIKSNKKEVDFIELTKITALYVKNNFIIQILDKRKVIYLIRYYGGKLTIYSFK